MPRSTTSRASGRSKKSPSKSVPSPHESETESEEEDCTVKESMKQIKSSLETILAKIETVQTGHETLEKLVTDKGGIQDEVSEVQENLGSTTDELELLKSTVQSQQKEISVLKNLIIHMSNKIDSQEKHITDLRTRSMHPNILIHGMEENDGEDLHKAVSDHIKTNFGIDDIQFSTIHRNGTKQTKGKGGAPPKPRFIVARLKDISKKDDILKAAAEYGKATDSAVRFTNQFPEDLRDKRQRLFHLRAEYKDKEIDCQVKHDKLIFADSHAVYREKVSIPKAHEILSAASNKATEERLKKINLVEGDKFQERKNKIISKAGNVKTFNDVKQFTLKAVLEKDCVSATSNVLVYRFRDSKGVIQEGWDNDNEFGAGQSILRAIQNDNYENIAVVMSRWVGEHLGVSRHMIFVNNALSAIEQLDITTA